MREIIITCFGVKMWSLLPHDDDASSDIPVTETDTETIDM